MGFTQRGIGGDSQVSGLSNQADVDGIYWDGEEQFSQLTGKTQ